LARASMDYGIALCLLGEEANEDLGAPLISLHRMQIGNRPVGFDVEQAVLKQPYLSTSAQ
jgi:hypothetical protein